MWRPKEGWETLRDRAMINNGIPWPPAQSEIDLVEAGADAIVKALKKNSKSLLKSDVSEVIRQLLNRPVWVKGYWVFIEEDKELSNV